MKYLKTFDQLNEGNIKDMEKKFSDYLKDAEGDVFELEKEMVDMLKDLLNLIVDKYGIETDESLDINILEHIEKSDPDNVLLDLKKTPLTFYGSKETFILKDIILRSDGEFDFKIDYDNEEGTQNVFAGFHLTYPIYAIILTLLNKDILANMNESLITDIEEYTKKRKSISGKISTLKKQKEDLDKKYQDKKDEIISHIQTIFQLIDTELIYNNDNYEDIDDYLEGKDLPAKISKIVHLDPTGTYFYFDHGDILIDEGGDTYDLSEFNIDQLFDILKILVAVPEISEFYNKEAFIKLNELHDYNNTKSNYLIQANKLLNKLIVSYDLFDNGDRFSLSDALKDKGVNIIFKGLNLYPNVELLDIIAEKEAWGYKFYIKCENTELDKVFEKPIDDLIKSRSAVNLFNAISKAINLNLLKNLND